MIHADIGTNVMSFRFWYGGTFLGYMYFWISNCCGFLSAQIVLQSDGFENVVEIVKQHHLV